MLWYLMVVLFRGWPCKRVLTVSTLYSSSISFLLYKFLLHFLYLCIKQSANEPPSPPATIAYLRKKKKKGLAVSAH